MSKKIIITIGREFGSEGHEIGRELADRLGISLYDKDLLAIAAKKSGLPLENLAEAEEKVASTFLMPYIGYGFDVGNTNDRLFLIESQIIREIAAAESCIIIGRLADYILRDDPDCLKVFIYAPLETRIEIVMKKHNISRDAAAKLVRKMDQARTSYYSYYTNHKWNQKEGKDIMLNRGKFGLTGCVDILEAVARERMK